MFSFQICSKTETRMEMKVLLLGLNLVALTSWPYPTKKFMYSPFDISLFIAGGDDLCVAMDGSERSYQLLGSFAAGQHLYSLDINSNGVPYILFSHDNQNATNEAVRVKVPMLYATEEHLKACEHKYW